MHIDDDLIFESYLDIYNEAKVDDNLNAIKALGLPQPQVDWLESLKEHDKHLIDALWIAKNYIVPKVDSFQEIRDQVTMFYQGKNKLQGNEKDIKTFRDYQVLKNTIASRLMGKQLMSKKQLQKQIPVFYEDNNIIVFVPKNKHEAIALSHGHPAFDGNHYTFCVGAEGGGMWESYTEGRGYTFFFTRLKHRDSSIASGTWGDENNPIVYKDPRHVLVLNATPAAMQWTFGDNNTVDVSRKELLEEFPELTPVIDNIEKHVVGEFKKRQMELLNSGEIPSDVDFDAGIITGGLSFCLQHEDLKQKLLHNISTTKDLIGTVSNIYSSKIEHELKKFPEVNELYSKYLNSIKQKITDGVYKGDLVTVGIAEESDIINHIVVDGDFRVEYDFFNKDITAVPLAVTGFHRENLVPRVAGSAEYTMTHIDNKPHFFKSLMLKAKNKYANKLVVVDELLLSNSDEFSDELGANMLVGGDITICGTITSLSDLLKKLPSEIGGEIYIPKLSEARYVDEIVQQNIVRTNVASVKQRAQQLYDQALEEAKAQAKAYWDAQTHRESTNLHQLMRSYLLRS